MMIFTDLHIHSAHSRATSKDITLDTLAKYGKIKGISVLGTGDFTHPEWFKNLKAKLAENEGIYEYEGMKFLLSTEMSLMYSQDGRGRKIHNVILAPSFEIAEQITEWLKTKGRVDYDGRPIFGFTCPELVENVMSISKDCVIIPAHIWTPHFSLFGSLSGFDRIEDCFQEKTKHIHALETGLSSDPGMNWRLSALDRYSLVSFSDAHSYWPWRLGRECCAFDLKKINYDTITNAIKTRKNFSFTLEFFPEEGKYHFDGHRNCNFSSSPEETKKLNGICPKCKRPLTIGVLNRVEELADREPGFRPKGAVDYKSLMPLSELISFVIGNDVYTKKVWSVYEILIERFGNEFAVLLDASETELRKLVKDKLVELIMKNRAGKLKLEPGYDGVYGHLIIEKEKKEEGLGRFF